MGYILEIEEDALCICGLYGTYKAKDNRDGSFNVSVYRDVYVNEIDSNGEEYCVDAGQEWSVHVKDLGELHSFISKCERERLWNYIPGPTYKVRFDADKGFVYLKGSCKKFIVSEDERGLYVDEIQTSKAHNHDYADNLLEVTQMLLKKEKWWDCQVEENLKIIKGTEPSANITDAGNLKIENNEKTYYIGQKENGSFWVNMVGGNERHICYKDSLAEAIKLIVDS